MQIGHVSTQEALTQRRYSPVILSRRMWWVGRPRLCRYVPTSTGPSIEDKISTSPTSPTSESKCCYFLYKRDQAAVHFLLCAVILRSHAIVVIDDRISGFHAPAARSTFHLGM